MDIVIWETYRAQSPPPAADPFQLRPHVRRRPGHLKALEVAAIHRGTIRYVTSNDILIKMGLELDQKTFYNLQHKETEGSLSEQEEARLALAHLES